jgi:hypothetical protein
MSGVIELEGRSPPVVHPQLDEVRMNALARRALKDFPLAYAIPRDRSRLT